MFVTAGHFWSRVLPLLGGAAITMPWRKIYILQQYADDEVLKRHELVHIEQINRDGALWFSLRYLWWLARYGYRRNPYEIEAYERENET